MKQIWEFLSGHKHAIIWTACYITIMWCILQFLFNFDMFSVQNWIRVSNARLHGFGGFVFGILTLAALPLYAATTMIILRTKKPLITIPVPVINKKTENTTEPDTIKENLIEQPTLQMPQKKLPPELNHQFMKLRQSTVDISQFKQSAIKSDDVSEKTSTLSENPQDALPQQPQLVPVMVQNPQPAPTQNVLIHDTPSENEEKKFINTGDGKLPLPDEFEFADDTADKAPMFSDINFDTMPTFTDVKFDDDNDDDTDTDDIPISAAEQQLIQYLSEKNITLENIENSVVITDKFAIAIHDDDDFWIADEPNWFAQGKQKTSPVSELLNVARSNNKKPIFWLNENNIMDLENKISEWTQSGVTVITDLDQISE